MWHFGEVVFDSKAMKLGEYFLSLSQFVSSYSLIVENKSLEDGGGRPALPLA